MTALLALLRAYAARRRQALASLADLSQPTLGDIQPAPASVDPPAWPLLADLPPDRF